MSKSQKMANLLSQNIFLSSINFSQSVNFKLQFKYFSENVPFINLKVFYSGYK